MKQIAVLLVTVVSLLPEVATACTVDDPCDPTSSSRYGEPVKLSPGNLRGRLIHCELPTLPSTLDAQGTVVLRVLVSPKGNVECTKVIYGLDLLNKAAIVAVKKWRFRPIIVKGKSVAMLGVVAVLVSWDADRMRKHCKTE